MSNQSSPYKTTAFHRVDYVKITILGFALTALWQSMHVIILPTRLLDFVPEALKNSYLGWLTFSGLLLGMVVQTIAGAISDRSSFSWGRRRAYILMGSIVAALLVPGIGFVGTYVAIFIVYCLLQVGTNTAQGPYQAFIPELVPEGKRGLASGVKGLLEILGGAIFVYLSGFLMGQYSADIERFWLWLALVLLAIVLLGVTVATILLVKEPSITDVRQRTSLLSALQQTLKDIRARPDFIWFLVSSARLYGFHHYTAVRSVLSTGRYRRHQPR